MNERGAAYRFCTSEFCLVLNLSFSKQTCHLSYLTERQDGQMLSSRKTGNWIFTYTNISPGKSCRVSEIGSVKPQWAEN